MGVHRSQRVPHNSQRRHTSTATVVVIPSDVLDADYRPGGESVVRRVKRAGKGGQHANKTETGVRLRHPSGIEVISVTNRSLHANLKAAEAEMERRLTEAAQDKRKTSLDKQRKRALHPERAAKVVTWNWQRGEIIHHESGKRVPLGRALKGDFDRLTK